MSLVGFPHHNDQQPLAIISAAIVEVINSNRLLGEVLLQLPRVLDESFNGVMGLRWRENQLVLVVNPEKLASFRMDEVEILLKHEALHIVWSHPLRYANHRHPQTVKVATDIAVNQYLDQPPAGTATLSQLQKLLRRRIPAKLDSQEYLNLLEALPPEEQEKLRQAGLPLAGTKRGDIARQGQIKPSESHCGWQTGQNSQQKLGNQTLRLANITQLLKRAWHETPQRDRGLLPGEMQQQLAKNVKPRKVPWQRVLRQEVGLLVRGQQFSHARFNRRQPVRMDLPGKVTRLVGEVNVFVDNSGSVSDHELSQALATIQRMTKQTQISINLFSFDAKVTAQSKVHPGKQVQFNRHGGGGTSFQCVFNYLREYHVPRQGSLTIIITDGWGEKVIRNYRYRNVCWLLLTSADQLSVENAPGRVVEMKGENNDNDS